MKERRKLERFILRIPARIEAVISINTRRTLDLLTSNVSAGGAFFPGGEGLPEGTAVKVDLKLPVERFRALVDCNEVSVKLNGTILRCGSAGMAVGFDTNYHFVPS